jgi:ribonuclease HII
MTEKRREAVVDMLKEVEKNSSDIATRIIFSSAKIIDSNGITDAIQIAINKGLEQLNPDPTVTNLFLDGGLKAPDRYTKQKTIVGGDGRLPIISLASVIAKVARDNLMKQHDTEYPYYNFSQHKGYGTKKHRKAIKSHGTSKIHRRTFLRNIL